MANKKINDLTLAGSISTTMQLETDIGGATANKINLPQLFNFYGVGQDTNLTLFFAPNNTTDIIWGYGTVAAFTEQMRLDTATGNFTVSAGSIINTGDSRLGIQATGTRTSTDGAVMSAIYADVGFTPAVSTLVASDFYCYPNFIPGIGATISVAAGLYIATGAQSGAGTVTAGYGIYVASPAYGTNKYAAYFGDTVQIVEAGTIKLRTGVLEITNTVNAANMDGTGVGVKANLWYYDAVTPAVWPAGAGGIYWVAEQDATSVATTQDSMCVIYTTLDGTAAETWRISSKGTLSFGGALPHVNFDTGRGILTQAVSPQFSLFDTSVAANNKGWDFTLDSTSLLIRAVNDDNSGSATFMRFDRSGMNITGIAIGDSFTPNSLVHLRKAGTAKATTDVLRIENTGNAVDMDGTSVALCADLWYWDAVTPAVWPAGAGRIEWYSEQDATSSVLTQNSRCIISTTLDGVSTQHVWITSAGNVGVGGPPGSYPIQVFKSGTVKTNTDLLALDNTGSAVDMDTTESSLLIRQEYHDVGSPLSVDSVRWVAGCETDWTSAGISQDSYAAIHNALNGSVSEKFRVSSGGKITNLAQVPTSNSAMLSILADGADTNNYGVLPQGIAIVNTNATTDNTAGLFFCDELDVALSSIVCKYIDRSAGVEDTNLIFSNAINGTLTPQVAIDNQGHLAIGLGSAFGASLAYPLNILKAGSAGSLQIFMTLRNSVRATANTENAIYFEHHADDDSNYGSGMISVLADGTWTSIATSRDSTMQFKTVLDGNLTNWMALGSKGVLRLGSGAVDSVASAVFTIFNGTEPSGVVTNGIQIYSKDSSVGAANATLAFYTEQAVEAIGTFTPSHKQRVWFNGVEYWIQLDAV